MSSIKRMAHVLKAEKTLAIPRHVIFFDTESESFTFPDGRTEHKLKLGVACYLRKGDRSRQERIDWIDFTQASEFWQFVFDHCTIKNKLWIIAHQISFDFTVAEGFRFLRSEGFKCRFFYSSGVTTLIKVKKKGSSIMFVDSLNWFKESLEKIGERIGILKLKIDFDNCTISELKIYCRRDVEILVGVFKQLTRFLEGNRISRLCYTIGSTAMAAYLFRHYRNKIYIHNNAEAIKLERAAFKGGRTECFYIGELNYGPYFVVDVNSLYPFVMHGNFFPVKYKKIVHNISLSHLRDFLVASAVIANVRLETPVAAYAVRKDRTIFPVGSFTATLSSPELSFALENNHIKSIESAVIYDRAKIFTSFVDRFYKIRQEFKKTDNPLFEHFCKILLNSLYGKFGQKAEDWKKIGDCPSEPDRIEDVIDAETHRRKRLRYLFGEVFEMIGHSESIHSFPAIAAHVTAYARLYLWKLMKITGPRNYFYCDTDSLFVNSRGLENLSEYLEDHQLGKLKVEYETDKISIYGLKDYVTNKGRIIKGIKKNAVKVSDTDYVQDVWPTIKGILRNTKTQVYTTKRMEKHLNRDYTKGIIDFDGWTVPYSLDGFVENL